MTTLTRWKLACALFATIAGGTYLHGRSGHDNTPAAMAVTTSSRAALPIQLRRPIRVEADAIGVNKSDLVDRMRAAHSLKEMVPLADKLGAVGDDEVVDTLVDAGMIRDPRRGVPELVLTTFGQIGTNHAVDQLIIATGDDRPAVRSAAVTALGVTQSAKAEDTLLTIAQAAGDPAQGEAIAGLGALASDRAVAVLVTLASNGDFSVIEPRDLRARRGEHADRERRRCAR